MQGAQFCRSAVIDPKFTTVSSGSVTFILRIVSFHTWLHIIWNIINSRKQESPADRTYRGPTYIENCFGFRDGRKPNKQLRWTVEDGSLANLDEKAIGQR